MSMRILQDMELSKFAKMNSTIFLFHVVLQYNLQSLFK